MATIAAPLTESQAQQLLLKLLPPKIRDRNGWADDILSAFTALRIPYEPEYFCAANAIIEQESTWQGDPTVPGLPDIAWKKIGEKANEKLVPLIAVKTALLKTSPDGRSYKARIDALRTEREMNDIFEDLSADAKRLGLPFSMANPIHTGGPMQVSVAFAEAHARATPYPYARSGTIRDAVFTRRGGVYFGIAILLQYPIQYPDMLFRFADYNAGRYASRNAAFQAALARVSGKRVDLDGDLLIYANGQAVATPSDVEQALLGLGARLGLSADAIRRDLLTEKTMAFGDTATYRKVFALADAKGRPAARAVLPQIRLVSPKITRQLTTEWFAKRVDGRYQTCLGRLGG
ncbi:MAG: DUF1615 domain-containing protein [Rhodocyclaceae bacterium]